ncbi:MAG TPA: HEAT repeat domain-containing protein [Pyrinomonadaceae bacterium]|nr:HEAT repeat domain-containing protein [Pyrinomonadaceae bacterium]
MKRFLTTVLFCALLLVLLSVFFFPVSNAAENPLVLLINLPAPPPPNPQVTYSSSEFEPDFFNKSKPPPDDAPLGALMEYWRTQSSAYRELGYNPAPSDKVVERLLAEVLKDPEKVFELLNAFRGSKKAGEVVKDIYDRYSSANEGDRNRRSELRRWLTYNSPFFSTDLARRAARVADVNEYVSNQDELLALGQVDWDRARPIVDRLYNGSQKVSRVLAQWALYRNALDTNSLDIGRYRDELKAVVEDRNATAGMRDLAFDALVKEKDWEGRDEWYYSLLSDETLADLRVNGTSYTGLTTIMYYSPDEKYIDKMVELVKSDNKTVRTAAAKNLAHRLNTNNPDVVRALLPWLQDPKWLTTDEGNRSQLIMALQRIKMPESVPALIAALDEKQEQRIPVYGNASNASNAATNAAWTAAQMMANTAGNAANGEAPTSWRSHSYYPLRSSAIGALGYQADPRAVPALRRLLNSVESTYEAPGLISAIYECGGFTLAEQVDAIEGLAKNSEASFAISAGASNLVANASAPSRFYFPYPTPGVDGGTGAFDIKSALGSYLAQRTDVKEDLAQAIVDRITSLDRSDPKTATVLRRLVTRWHSAAVNLLFLADLKNNQASAESIVRLLTVRAELREKQMPSLFEIRTGSPIAVGVSACLIEDPNDYEAILDGESNEAKTALLACGRLVRAELPVKKVAELLRSKDPLLTNAAERYLETEDSPEARRIVLSLHPNEAKILGATIGFFGNHDLSGAGDIGMLQELFATVSPYYKLPNSSVMVPEYFRQQAESTETRVQDELKKDPALLGVYNWELNYIHIYKEHAVFSWEDDPARYRERQLTSEEFDNFKGLIAHFKADELPPFLSCTQCVSRQLLMVGRSGGRRVYIRTDNLPPLFAELERTFADLRVPPSTIKYWASKDVPGLEVVFANDRLDAMSVFKNGSDFRLLTADKVQRTEIDNQIEELVEDPDENDQPDIADIEEIAVKREAERTRREYENYAWQTFSSGALSGSASQPAEVPFIPAKDDFKVPAGRGQWKARSGTVEVRASDEGLFKLANGKLTKIRTGSYRDPVVTPNGRWVVATKYDDDSGDRLVRVNLATNKELEINSDELPVIRAIAYVPSINRMLVGPYREDYSEYDVDVAPSDEADAGNQYSWLDPETGTVVTARGEVRPIAQQEWRALQPAAGPFEFWAAIPRSKETIVGIFNTRTFTMKTLATLPKISFSSTDMWVDAADGKAYFVYQGHLLSMPLKQAK